MDPKLSSLDPKLQDAYNRVMSGPAAPPQPQNPLGSAPSQPEPTLSAPPPPTPPIEPPQPAPEPPPAPADFNQAPPAPAPIPIPQASPSGFDVPVSQNEPAPMQQQQSYGSGTMPATSTTVAFNASNNQKNQGTTPVKKGGFGIMPVIAGVAIVFLLVAYTFVWIVLFNVQVPFLPQL